MGVGNTFSMYTDVLGLEEDVENRKQWDSSNWEPTTELYTSHKPKQRPTTAAEWGWDDGALGAPYGTTHESTDVHWFNEMKKKVNENFSEKEKLIKMLSQELDKEKDRREQMDQQFKETTLEFEKQVK